MKHLALLSILVALLLAACSSTSASDPCGPDNADATFEAIRDTARRFDDAEKLAIAVPRDEIAEQVAVIQAIRREAEDLEVAPCANVARQALVAYIDANINMMLAFLDANTWDTTQSHWIETVFTAREEYIAAMRESDQDPGLTIPALLLTPTAPEPGA